MVKYQSYPTPLPDEPVSYKDFTGGINTDPSNEHLMPNELRDCVNMTYLSGALVKRKGASEMASLECEDDLFNIQGIFLFTYRITYLIVAADGRLYYGVFNEHTTIHLQQLKIYVPNDTSKEVYNPQYVFNDFKERYSRDSFDRHEGYIYSYELINGKPREYANNFIGKWEDLTDTTIIAGDILIFNGSKYKYVNKDRPFNKVTIFPDNSPEHWALLSQEEYETISKDPAVMIYRWHEKLDPWKYGDYVSYRHKFYKCIKEHMNYLEIPTYGLDWKPILEEKEFVFQNYRKIEAATFNNKLFITTGSLFINIFLKNNILVAEPVTPYRCNNTEIRLIGYNYLSPYPEYCRASQYNTVTTSIDGILPIKSKDGSYILQPQMNFKAGDSAQDYYYRWEKKINNQWYVIYTFKSQDPNNYLNKEELNLPILSSIKVYDADKFQYRVTFSNSFDAEDSYIAAWDIKTSYKKNDFASIGANVYQCLIDHTPIKDSLGAYEGKDSFGNTIVWDNPIKEFSITGTVKTSKEVIKADGTKETITNEELKTFWKLIHTQESIKTLSLNTGERSTDYDYAINKVDGSFFGQATSVLATDVDTNDTFRIIQTCTKIHVDGNKLLLYADRFNSGQWFKTIINNPGYITSRGCLDFKTYKNEAVIKVIAFQGNIIIFANAESIGGSIHIVKGNGDDYDAKDGYYSPYRRSTINASISCDNPDTIQICDNLLVFKYFNRVYCINASDLNNEVIQVTPCNDRLLYNNNHVLIPWDDNNCISEVTDTYYGLIWKEKYMADKNGELILIHPATRVKMYYKMSNALPDRSYSMPWLRDESEYLNVEHCLYIKGKPMFLYNNLLLSFSEDVYQDLNKNFKASIHFKGVDCNYPELYKLLANTILYYHRNQYYSIDINIEARNEAGHLLLDNDTAMCSLQDLKVLKADELNIGRMRLDSTILDTRILNATYKFPFLLIDTSIDIITKGEFSLSGIAYNYNTLDSLNTNPYDLYTSIIRKKDIIIKKNYEGGK